MGKDNAEGKTKRKKPTQPYANCAKAVRKSTNGLLLLFNMDFNDKRVTCSPMYSVCHKSRMPTKKPSAMSTEAIITLSN